MQQRTTGMAEAPDARETERPSSLKVLVAEDHPTNRLVVQMMLEPLGFDLTFAENGQEALDAHAGQRFDVVLMDLQMPVMDGLSAMRAIRAREAAGAAQRVAIAVLSANVGDEHRSASALAGADAHIAKPVTLEVLIDGVSHAIRRSHAAQRPPAFQRRRA